MTKQQQQRRKNGSSSDNNKMQLLSRKLSKVLRHNALAMGLPIAPTGYIPVSALLEHSMFQQYTLDDIMTVVRTSDKQRFHLKEQDNNNDGGGESLWLIRANQGHSMEHVKAEELLQELSKEELSSSLLTIVHGTYTVPWESSIRHTGLNRMQRNHIHFATAIPGDEGKAVISGMRKSSQVYIYIDGPKCAEDGIVFYKSANGVLLTSGVNGTLAPKYFRKVTDNKGNELPT